jgi:hypothetical protein
VDTNVSTCSWFARPGFCIKYLERVLKNENSNLGVSI